MKKSPVTSLPQAVLALSTAQRASLWLLALLVAGCNFLAWEFWAKREAPTGLAEQTAPRLPGIAYAPFGRHDAPWVRDEPLANVLQRDLTQLSSLTDRVRTYSSLQFDGLPQAVQAAGMRLSLGVWLNSDWANNQREMQAALAHARAGRAEHLIVGNETILRKDLTVAQLIEWLRIARVQQSSKPYVPISTAEPWHVWLAHPELAAQVDFITVHLLPYWEGVAFDGAVEQALVRLQWVRDKHPGKRIVIGEVGYPSGGQRVAQAVPSPDAQAHFVRDWMTRAQALGLDYFLIEAYDQAWKAGEEGQAGAYWGLFDANRQPKFSFTGPLIVDTHWFERGLASSALGLLLILWFLHRFPNLRWRSRVGFALGAQMAATLATVVVTLPLLRYMRWFDWATLALLSAASVVMLAIILAHWLEFSELFLRGNLKRRFAPKPLTHDAREPFVSIHLPICNEPPEMVLLTLKSLQALDYTAFEVIVIDNNTSDPALWQPVRDYMASLPPHYRFIHLPQWPGFKAGALNVALEQMDSRTQVVAVVDADYVVKPHWLRDLLGHFDDPQVAVVQAPQAHRNWISSAWRSMMNWEYEGFFRIGMHHRNERDAIIQHGTMTLIRAQALRSQGCWTSGALCEDAELGLRLMQAGYRTVYVDVVMGEGLTPDTFAAFKRQRLRWAQGGMHILKMHGRALFWPNSSGQAASRLSVGQRYHFLAGWLPWIGDALHLMFVLLALGFTALILMWPQMGHWPTGAYWMPLAAFAATKLIIGPALYARRVTSSVWGIVGASVAGMGLSHAIARGVWAGLLGSGGQFGVTAKGSNHAAREPATARWGVWQQRLGALRCAREECLLLVGCLLAALAVSTSGASRPDAAVWSAMLVLLALPYAAALACALMSQWPVQREHARPQTQNLEVVVP
jgi:exo-beta-1,3-glucanase (GH17 family)/cellulose synthase/poly-beta-1,6-N-acetylglucosamine synthase-like glycosyltransferase